MGRIGSWVPWHVMLAPLAPHCWNATSFAEPEYVMDFTSPSAFCALAITVLASCAMALPHRSARPMATTSSFLNTASPLSIWLLSGTHPCWIFYIHPASCGVHDGAHHLSGPP